MGDSPVRRIGAGGAAAGVIAALLFRNADPRAARKRYSWEDEEDAEQLAGADNELEPPAPGQVPVLWQPREGRDYEVVVPLRRRDSDERP